MGIENPGKKNVTIKGHPTSESLGHGPGAVDNPGWTEQYGGLTDAQLEIERAEGLRQWVKEVGPKFIQAIKQAETLDELAQAAEENSVHKAVDGGRAIFSFTQGHFGEHGVLPEGDDESVWEENWRSSIAVTGPKLREDLQEAARVFTEVGEDESYKVLDAYPAEFVLRFSQIMRSEQD